MENKSGLREAIQQFAMEVCYWIFGKEGTAFLVKAIQDTLVILAFTVLMVSSTELLKDIVPKDAPLRPIFEIVHEGAWIVGVLFLVFRWVKYLWKTTFGNENG